MAAEMQIGDASNPGCEREQFMTRTRSFGRVGSVSRVVLCAGLGFGSLGLCFASGCSSNNQPAVPTAGQTPNPTSTPFAGQSSGSQTSGVASGQAGAGVSAIPTATAGTGATASQAGAGAPAAPTAGSAGSAGGAGGSSGTGGSQSTNAAGNGAQPDCTPSEWKDPGTVASPKVELVPADAGKMHGLFGASKNIGDYAYAEDEFFVTGTSPAYTTRIVVHRPKDAAKFTGTVFMEWYNVTGGIDIAPLWTLSRDYMMREGHVHVGVSAQAVGANALKDYDSERYAAIKHPGDTAANAIFGQVAMAIRSQTETLLGRCMPVHAMIGVGQSQSSALLGVYLSDAHPKDKMYDGFLLHTNPTGGTPTTNPNVPVFVVFSMTEADGKLANQPNVLEWEMAGCTHNDYWLTTRGAEEQGSASSLRIECANPMNNFPSFWAYDTVLDQLQRWVRKGTKPPSAPPIESTLDQYGNVKGGVRLPDIDVPIASYTKSNEPKDPTDFISIFACGLSGSVVSFTADRLMELYPTHDDYVQKYTQAADKAVAAGFMLQADRDLGVDMAQKAPIPK
jgi:hypothetical protein